MKLIGSLLFTACLITGASATTIVQTKSYSFVPNGNQTLTFDKFDTTYGTLTSVTVSVSMLKSGGSLAVDNDSATGGTINLTHEVVGQLSSNDVSLRKTGAGNVFVGQSGSVTATSTFSTTIGATTGDSTTSFDNTGSGDYVSYSPDDASASDSGTIRSADIGDYESVGAATFDVNFAGLQTTNVTGLGGLQQAFTVSGLSGDVTVTFNYVPEPSAALLGGLGMLALLRRRRR